MKQKPIISIITPLYNSARFIFNTFNSVVNQSFSNWEWIIIDDCSDDDSFLIVKGLSEKETRIKVFKTPTNSGTSVARNIGLMNALGKYITFLDSDDLIDSNYLESQLDFIKNNGPLISSSYRRKTQHSCTVFEIPDETNYKDALKGNPLSCLTTMYDKSIIGEVFFPENIEKPEDYVFWLNILKRGFVAKGNKNVLATYVMHSGSKSSNKIKLIRNMFIVYHNTQGINWFKSWLYVFRWALYGFKKYKNVK